ncbi:basic salivary proline-rich protein 2-like [Cavia porcellus]|uniref:basic salivary proline-rich protein 2-like n=1 Tax=Cavia porcellus TaxID=10141 RepID=UPI002FE3377F
MRAGVGSTHPSKRELSRPRRSLAVGNVSALEGGVSCQRAESRAGTYRWVPGFPSPFFSLPENADSLHKQFLHLSISVLKPKTCCRRRAVAASFLVTACPQGLGGYSPCRVRSSATRSDGTTTSPSHASPTAARPAPPPRTPGLDAKGRRAVRVRLSLLSDPRTVPPAGASQPRHPNHSQRLTRKLRVFRSPALGRLEASRELGPAPPRKGPLGRGRNCAAPSRSATSRRAAPADAAGVGTHPAHGEARPQSEPSGGPSFGDSGSSSRGGRCQECKHPGIPEEGVGQAQAPPPPAARPGPLATPLRAGAERGGAQRSWAAALRPRPPPRAVGRVPPRLRTGGQLNASWITSPWH